MIAKGGLARSRYAEAARFFADAQESLRAGEVVPAPLSSAQRRASDEGKVRGDSKRRFRSIIAHTLSHR